MTLRTRLQRLEALTSEIAVTSSGSTKELMERLEAGAVRLHGTAFSADWCARSSPMEIACASWHELDTGNRTPSLWGQAAELARGQGPVASLFAGLSEVANAA